MYVTKERPTQEMVEKAWIYNDDGGGLAWREKDPITGVVQVLWKKGIETPEEMWDLCSKLPIPYVAHFRVASSGGIRPQLTHPFPITHNSPLALSGRTSGYVLFHNGDWKEWHSEARLAAIHSGVKVPSGKWSDSRAIAWLSSIYGEGFLEFLPNQKGIAFGPKNVEIFIGGGWTEVNEVWCSNRFFMDKVRNVGGVAQHNSYTGDYCKYGNCTIQYNLDARGFCFRHKDMVTTPKDEPNPHGFAKPAEAGGAQQPTPFCLLPQGEIITIARAQELHEMVDPLTGQKRLSKNLLKKIKGIYSDLSQDGKKAQRARGELQKVSRQLSSANGPVH
jgi:hypothetical protein